MFPFATLVLSDLPPSVHSSLALSGTTINGRVRACRTNCTAVFNRRWNITPTVCNIIHGVQHVTRVYNTKRFGRIEIIWVHLYVERARARVYVCVCRIDKKKIIIIKNERPRRSSRSVIIMCINSDRSLYSYVITATARGRGTRDDGNTIFDTRLVCRLCTTFGGLAPTIYTKIHFVRLLVGNKVNY